MSKKKSVEEVKEIISKFNLELIGEIYTNNKDKIITKDSEGYYYSVVLSSVIRNFAPEKFHISNIYTIQNIRLWCKLNNKPFKLLSDIFEGHRKKLKWKCLKEDCGEIFERSWDNIYIKDKGCDYCTGQKIGLSNCLVIKNPLLASEWHLVKNGDLTPWNVTISNFKYVWWQCKDNPEHEWNYPISPRINPSYGNCPYCSHNFPTEDYNLLIINPRLCEEWDYKKNKKRPEEYLPNSHTEVWWICKEKGHNWEAIIKNRNINETGCPYCSGDLPSEDYNLLLDNPELCKEWDYNKNDKLPSEYTPKSGQKVWWICKDCGREWDAIIGSRNGRGCGCPDCNKSKGEKKCKEVFINKNFIEISQENYGNFTNNDNTYFISQKTFDDLVGVGVGGGLLSYDFYLPNKYNLLVEYQGEFHNKIILNYKNEPIELAEERLIKQKEHDRRKKEYALSNGYNFLEIWYKDFDNIETILNDYLKELSKNDNSFYI